MKWYLFILVSVLFSCKKDNHTAGIPDGVWVDQARSQDTIITYKERGKNILFDNSTLYRSAASQLSNKDYYKWKYSLTTGKINIKNYSMAAEEYMPYDFTWTTEGQEFSMTANAIRPYLSSLGTKLIYRKVR
ncbi:MAG: hypothetical protein INR73_27190 [Williamsia sp.]|nr:hypothetical protein [Williamsia sp.]